MAYLNHVKVKSQNSPQCCRGVPGSTYIHDSALVRVEFPQGATHTLLRCSALIRWKDENSAGMDVFGLLHQFVFNNSGISIIKGYNIAKVLCHSWPGTIQILCKGRTCETCGKGSLDPFFPLTM